MWFACALLAALAGSFGDVSAKKIAQHYHFAVVAWAQRIVAAAIMCLVAVCVTGGMPRIDGTFCRAFAVSVAINTATTLMYTRAIHVSDISRVTPILALSPTFLLVTAPLIASETITPAGMGGILLAVVGAYVLGVNGKEGGWLAPFRNLWKDPGMRLMLGVALLWSVTGPLDLIAVQHTDAAWYPAMFNAGLAVTLAPFALMQPGFRQALRLEGLRRLTPVGICIGVSQLFQVFAFMLIVSVAYVTSVKRLQAVFTVLLGWRVYREKGIGWKLLGALILSAGATIVLFGGR